MDELHHLCDLTIRLARGDDRLRKWAMTIAEAIALAYKGACDITLSFELDQIAARLAPQQSDAERVRHLANVMREPDVKLCWH